MNSRSAMILGGSFILGCCILGLLITMGPTGRDPMRPFESNSAVPKVGRYQISGVPGHMFVLDSATGRLWEKFVPEGNFESSGFTRVVVPPTDPLMNDISDADEARKILEARNKENTEKKGP